MIIDGKTDWETNPKNYAQISKQISTQIIAQQLHREFIRLGAMRHKLKNRLLAILPQIYESGIWKKYAGSIEEYAGKFGDIAKTTVKKRPRLEENLEDKPYLKAAIEKVGVHKVALVAKIATPETDQAFAENIMNMSKMAVQSLSKEIRAGQNKANADDCQQTFSDNTRPCRAASTTKKIELDEESTFLFMKLKAKLGKNMTDKEFFKLILRERERQEFFEKQNKAVVGRKKPITKAIATTIITPNIVRSKAIAVANEITTALEKSSLNKNANKCAEGKTINSESLFVKTGQHKSITGDTFRQATKPAAGGSQSRPGRDSITSAPNTIPARAKTSRYIPINKKRQIIAQTNGKCSYPNCNLPFQILHHTDRYSESKNHDSIIPLCKIHHEFAHNNLIQNENSAAGKWQLIVTGSPTAQIAQAEILYKKYRQKLIA